MKIQLITAVAALWSCHVAWAEEPADPDIALKPAHVIVNPWRWHIPPTKRQGVPGIERTAKGRLCAVYGRDVESTRNYQVLTRSDDDGKSWSDAQLMILPRRGVRHVGGDLDRSTGATVVFLGASLWGSGRALWYLCHCQR